MEHRQTLAEELAMMVHEREEQAEGHDHEHHCHHDHDHEDGHCCHHDHDHEEGHCCHHGHDHEEGHCCHHHHHADEVFTSWGVETPKKFTEDFIRQTLEELEGGEQGTILRAKGIVPTPEGQWLHFDYVPGEIDVRTGPAAVTGRLCVIGAQLDEAGLARLFGVVSNAHSRLCVHRLPGRRED